MALPVIPILAIAALGVGALMLGRSKKTSLGGSFRVLSRAEAAAIGGGKATYVGPTGETVPAASPLLDTMIANMTAVGSQVSIVLQTPAIKVILAIAIVDSIAPGPVYDGHIAVAKEVDLKTKILTPLDGPPFVGAKVKLQPRDIIDVVPAKDLTMNSSLPQSTFST